MIRSCRSADFVFDKYTFGMSVEAVESSRKYVDGAFERDAHDPTLRNISSRCPGKLDVESFYLFATRMWLSALHAIRTPCLITRTDHLLDVPRVDMWVIAWNGMVTQWRRTSASRWDLVVGSMPGQAIRTAPPRRWVEAYYWERDLRLRSVTRQRSHVEFSLPLHWNVEYHSPGVPARLDPSDWRAPEFLWTIAEA
jgi:hypothetical protein